MKSKLMLFIIVIFTYSCTTQKIRTTAQNKPIKSTKTYQKPIIKSVDTKTNPAKDIAEEKPKATENKSSEVLVATSKVKVTTEDVKKYISTYSEIAKNEMRTNNVPASITMAQAILESGTGFGTLAMNANNHFGIKCHTGWTGETVKHDDDALQECFRKYTTVKQSFEDHSIFLKRKRYENLFKLDKGDYEGWAKGLKAAGYATDPQYPQKLIGLIERYELYQLDNEVLGRDFKPKPKDVKPKEDVVGTPNEIKEITANDHIVVKGDTLYNISKRYQVTVAQLIEWNAIENNAISIGQVLKIKK
jgi:flagellum-specific peptidoglycan hydrolase FlgJ